MPTAADLKSLSNRSGEAQLPVPELKLARLPKKVTDAFSSLIDWERSNDRMFNEWTKKVNTKFNGG